MSKFKRTKTFQKLLQLISKFSQALTKNHLQWLLRNFIVTSRRSFYILASLVISKTQPLARKAVSKPKRAKTFRKPLQLISNSQPRTKNQLKWLLRSFIVTNKRPTAAKNGFVLPTAALLLVVMSLLISALLFRSVNRTNQVVGQREEKVIYNAASPAIDRAKAKLEYLFREDKRLPNGLPSDPDLEDMLRNDGTRRSDGATFPQADVDDNPSNGIQNPYIFPGEPGETQLDINNDGNRDPAWSFQVDTNGDGQITEEDPTVAYSILLKTQQELTDLNNDGDFNDPDEAVRRENRDDRKAAQLVVRNGPIDIAGAGNADCSDINLAAEAGWDSVNGATVRKAFQVTAFVVNKNGNNKAVATLEMQQDRQANRGNKWGAWFRNDLEIFPGPQFNWNGAMHTEGSLIIGDSNSFRGYLISSPKSCIYSPEASEITVAGNAEETTSTSFLGQIINGSLKTNIFGGSSIFDFINKEKKGSPNESFTINADRDSVNPFGGNPDAMSLDPVVLWTRNVSQSRLATDPFNSAVRDSSWNTNVLVKNKRIYNSLQDTPYLDDTYRADNRYGPKPTYGKKNSIGLNRDATGVNQNRIGDEIQTSDPNFNDLTLNAPTDPNDTQTFGFDGYWERRAKGQGLRVIVGQRLELGNTYGWQGAGNDPLYPPDPIIAVPAPNNTRRHELRQWRTLRDNLAAVQATAVYHYNPDGDVSTDNSEENAFPVACLATTAHPGTLGTAQNPGTIPNSTTFNNIGINNQIKIDTDFFTGNGTNGWEFNPPGGTVAGSEVTTEGDFARAISNGQPLRIALTNLAHFAGDPFGAFPARQDTAAAPAVRSVGVQVHPYPQLTMWGNFSELRRAIKLLDDGTRYEDLSLADQTTLQTASCTVGMLAYKMQLLSDYNYANPDNQVQISHPNPAVTNDLDDALRTLSDGNPALLVGNPARGPNNGEVIYLPTEDLNGDNILQPAEDLNNDGNLFPAVPNITVFRDGSITPISRKIVPMNTRPSPEDYVLGLQNLATGLLPQTNSRLARFIQLKEQVQRDRRFGFAASFNFNNVALQLGCDISPAGNNFFGVPPGAAQQATAVRLAQALCPTVEPAAAAAVPAAPSVQPKFPSLYYLFPVANHDHLTASPQAKIADPTLVPLTQPNNEPYITQTYIFNPAVTDDVNDDFFYRVLDDSDNNHIENGTENGIGKIAIKPRDRNSACGNDGFCLPRIENPAANAVNTIQDNTFGGAAPTPVRVPFMDKGMFNGREMMNVRVLDIDLDLLRNNAVKGGETWFPYSGVIYAFREDALREDAIARPAATNSSNCNTAFTITSANCLMNAVGANPQDPPVNGLNANGTFELGSTGISPKPVDFYADPDRRPYGFRLRNGKDLRRNANSAQNAILNGLSFVSDNPVYIVGDQQAFNLHNDAATGNRIEEFTNLLDGDTWNNFYDRGKPGFGKLNRNFARVGDTWRPAEIIADAISILSDFFNEGFIAQGIRRDGPVSSYGNLNAANNANLPWVREDGSTSNDVNNPIPIKISRNGFPLYFRNAANPQQEYGNGDGQTYMTFNDGKNRIQADGNTRINVTIVSGIVPSRAGQSYGGLHNFPRFLESWGNNLFISGALMQLNFSTSATAPFDQDSWEPGIAANAGGEQINYYSPPNRRWGYDVGLQYAPAGPVAKRFVSLDKTRSEFYRELPVDDPYIMNLRCAVNPDPNNSSGAKIDPTVTSCP